MTTNVSIQPHNGLLAVFTPYNANFLADFKAQVPARFRRFDGASKAWIIAPTEQAKVIALIETHYAQVLQPVTDCFLNVGTMTRKLRLEYLGQCKPREGGEVYATGWVDGGWNVIFPESTLREFFQAGQGETLYSLLGVGENASPDEIKAGHRRAARTWHPDVCKEENATEMFQQIQTAWETLREPLQKRKYDAGLYFERSQAASLKHSRWEHYVSPFRCGLLNVTGVQQVKGLHVQTIHSWNEIKNADGQVMTSSWPRGGDNFVINWVEELS